MLGGCFSQKKIYETSLPGELLVNVSESKITELFIFLYVEDNATIFFLTRDCAAWFVFLENFEFEKSWEMKNLPWDREKASENVWHTVKPWELRGL